MSVDVKSAGEEVAAAPWRPVARRVASVAIVLHLLAVFVPPFSFQTSPIPGLGSPVAEMAMDLLQPYIDLAYLNHGYAFFAPDPGPSHLLRAELQYEDGRPAEYLILPDLDEHWPRLLYHRHFMLSEHLSAAFAPPEPPPEIASVPDQVATWRFVREMYERRRGAIEEYLRRRYGADRVFLDRLEHRMLDPYEKFELKQNAAAEDTFHLMPESLEGVES